MTWFSLSGENYAHTGAFTGSMGLDKKQGNTPTEMEFMMTESRRNRLDDDRARKWLAKHTPKQASEPKPQWQPPERWQIQRQEQKQEWRVLRKPLLRGIE